MNIQKRKNSYLITVSAGFDAEGNRVRKTTTFKPELYTKTGKRRSDDAVMKEVEQFARAWEKEVLNADGREPLEKITYAEFVKRWEKDWATLHLSQSVREGYIQMNELHAFPFIGSRQIGEIKPMDIQAIVVNMQGNGLKSSTIKRVMASINSIFRFAERMELIEKNPCRNVELPKQTADKELHYFTVEQAHKFFEILETGIPVTYGERERVSRAGNRYKVSGYETVLRIPTQYQSYFHLAVYGGFRRSELLALRWSDIDFINHTVSIRRAAAGTSDGVVIKEPKTEAGKRTLTLPASVFRKLAEWKEEQRILARNLGAHWEGYTGKSFDENYVFIRLETGRMMGLSTPTHKFREIITQYNSTCDNKEDKLPLIKLHDLRHTSASLLIEAGVNIEEVARRLGHSKTSVTLDVYGHALPAADKAASEAIEGMLDN